MRLRGLTMAVSRAAGLPRRVMSMQFPASTRSMSLLRCALASARLIASIPHS